MAAATSPKHVRRSAVRMTRRVSTAARRGSEGQARDTGGCGACDGPRPIVLTPVEGRRDHHDTIGEPPMKRSTTDERLTPAQSSAAYPTLKQVAADRRAFLTGLGGMVLATGLGACRIDAAADVPDGGRHDGPHDGQGLEDRSTAQGDVPAPPDLAPPYDVPTSAGDVPGPPDLGADGQADGRSPYDGGPPDSGASVTDAPTAAGDVPGPPDATGPDADTDDAGAQNVPG
jgi:hypothetical protein